VHATRLPRIATSPEHSMSTRAVLPKIATLALIALAAAARADPWHVTALGAGWMNEQATAPAPSAQRLAPAALGRDTIVPGAPRASGLHASRAGLFMDWPLLAGLRLNGWQPSPLRADWRDATGLQRPGGLDLSDRAVASNAVVLIDAGDRASLSEGRGPSLAGTSLAALDAQLAQLRAGIARTRATPQASLGIRVKF
jgi:hypothetical protein